MTAQAQSGVFWRIVDESGAGPDSVTLVFQTPSETSDSMQLETDIVTTEYLSYIGKQHIDVAWTTEDSELLTILLQKQFPDRFDSEQGMRLDLSDEAIVDTLAVIAAARFGNAQDSTDWVSERPWNTLQRSYEVGDMVALATDEGFCLGVLVELDAVEAQVVLLQWVDGQTAECEARLHELIRVYKADLLPDTFGHVMPVAGELVH
ncbi:MAG: hypothetical protein JXQ97_01615 [Natronospirillum sp.]